MRSHDIRHSEHDELRQLCYVYCVREVPHSWIKGSHGCFRDGDVELAQGTGTGHTMERGVSVSIR